MKLERLMAVQLLILMFLLTFALFYLYHDYYDIPFGKYDVDNYMCFIGESVKLYHEDCPPVVTNYASDRIHFGFIQVIRMIDYYVGDFSLTFTFFIPVFICIIIPCGYYFVGKKYFQDVDKALIYTVLIVFGTFTYFLFGWLSLWSQMMGYFFYLMFLSEYLSGRHPVMYAHIILSVFFHPYVMMVYLIFLLSYLIDSKRWKLLIVFGVLAYLVYGNLNIDYLNYTKYGGSILEPSLYQVTFIHLNPILLFISVIGMMADKKHRTLYLLLSLLVFSHFSRGVVYFIPVMMLKVVEYMEKHRDKYLILFFFVFIHFTAGMYGHFIRSYVMEMDCNRWMDISHIKKMTGYQGLYKCLIE